MGNLDAIPEHFALLFDIKSQAAEFFFDLCYLPVPTKRQEIVYKAYKDRMPSRINLCLDFIKGRWKFGPRPSQIHFEYIMSAQSKIPS